MVHTLNRQPEGFQMFKKFLSVLAMFAVGVMGAQVVSSPAQAVGPCYANTICFFNESSTYQHHDNCEIYDCDAPPPVDCRTTSPITSFISNTSGYRWLVFTSTNCSGTRGVIYPRSSGSMTGVWNNSIRSYYRTSQTS